MNTPQSYEIDVYSILLTMLDTSVRAGEQTVMVDTSVRARECYCGTHISTDRITDYLVDISVWAEAQTVMVEI